ncbi:multidrug ABC transporter ATP-binding protein [Rhodoblastus sphagnicola]|uniref:Multidrug ABC transporter ATP-binding protein n=1 Tax=Rhodoblastus sphagnicola TaxID=333368 RepID=A0A2S6N7W5_9HYPH|nr:ribosome-associated ATPase/putative transporter RbbA [Rhodoblastus sphagnicola]MBB4197853.1 ribosome-dependent ATPase [Rhodoblastus sphagnicola]PPQ30687.1 multidrug ABC transporter ATP-binding protein [Rhodoblastus sphagnicola]
MSDVAALANVTQLYGTTRALDDVTIALPEGKMIGLIGPDGVGKSTLLALVAGVRRIQSGGVTALGGDMADSGHRAACAARIAYMPQGLGRNLYPTLSVFENLDFFGRLFGQGAAEREARIKELLASTGLDPFPDRPAGQLSGGMKQKLSLCCALIHDPDLLILDEPTTGVDPLSRRQFWDLIDRIRARRPGMSVAVATAYMEEAERFDWLAALDGGKIIGSGAPADLRALTREKSLDAAFIALLPPEARADHSAVVLPPLVEGEGYAIEAENLTCRFGKFTAVDHVNFRIRRGEIFGFLGSNGCGKSTTMKMLTGLLAPTEGEALLFGQRLDAGDMATRRRVGYMSQGFSLYSELTVRQNLVLHAQLFELPEPGATARVKEMLARFDLDGVADQKPESLPLGIRQRLQLAVAVLHKPEVLILDEPTSGVDPIARDSFWRLLIALSREDGVTIFISTHFMNEAERCDRISLMHAGKVLAVDAPAALVAARGKADLEQTFISYLEGAGEGAEPAEAVGFSAPRAAASAVRRFDPARLWAYARREAMEILRDRLRLIFAFVGPLTLLLTFGYGISFDVENLAYAVNDQDNSLESRELLENFAGSRYFSQKSDVTSASEIDRRLSTGELKLVVEIPAGFGRDLVAGKGPRVAVWIDGAMPFRGETIRSYITGISQTWLAEQHRRRGLTVAASPINVETRFRYNQAFKSIYSIIPGVIMLILMLVPSMLTALGVVREKEVGSIANFRSTPVTRVEFLLGKQAPYIVLSFVSFGILMATALLLFGLPVRGSALALVLGAAFYIYATTSLGILFSAFLRTQVAALFATAVVSIIPAVNFSGLLVSVASLSTGGRLVGLAFPCGWFQEISIGAFTKGMDFMHLAPNLLVLLAFGLFYQLCAVLALRKQEA